jgi:hypothetical protein
MTRVVLAYLLVCCAALAADENRHDGTWWNRQSAGFRVLYILGFMDGMELGNRFSTPDSPEAAKGARDAGDPRATYKARVGHYFSNVTVGEISDALDAFYRDARNRSIPVPDGFEIVLRSIKGEDVTKLIEARRSASAGKNRIPDP